MDGFLALIDKLMAAIPADAGFIVIIAGVIDFVFRLVKTDKPKSIAYFIAGAFHKLGALFEKIAMLMDKVLPQRTAEPIAPPAEKK